MDSKQKRLYNLPPELETGLHLETNRNLVLIEIVKAIKENTEALKDKLGSIDIELANIREVIDSQRNKQQR